MKSCETLFLEAAYDPSHLTEALRAASNLFDGNAAQLIAFDNKGALLSSNNIGFDDNAHHKWHEYLEISPRFIAGAQMKAGDIVFDYLNMTDKSIEKDITYQELLKPSDLDWYAGAKLIETKECTVLFGVFRGGSSEHFDAEELRRFKWLSDRISDIARTALKIDEIKWRSKYSALENWHDAIAAISSESRILESSPRFSALLKRYNLGRLGVNGSIIFNNPRVSEFINRSLSLSYYLSLTPNPRKDVVFKSQSGHWIRLRLHDIPLDSRWSLSGAVRLLSLEEISDLGVSPQKVSEVLSLTIAESEVAILLANGRSFNDAARLRQTSYGTIKSQVKSIYAKTDCRNQTELAILLNRLFDNM